MLAKEEISHFIKYVGLPEENEEEEKQIEPPMAYLPRFSEVTITPACSRKIPNDMTEGDALDPGKMKSDTNLATPFTPQEMTELPLEQFHMPIPVAVEPWQSEPQNLWPVNYGYSPQVNFYMHSSGMMRYCGHNGNMSSKLISHC